MIQLRKISVDARQILRPADYQPRGLHLRQAHNLGKPVAMPTPADPPGRLRQQALAGLLSSDLRGSKSEKKPGNLVFPGATGEPLAVNYERLENEPDSKCHLPRERRCVRPRARWPIQERRSAIVGE